MTTHVDKTALCLRCGRRIEHYAGIPGSEWMTPYWRAAADDSRPHPHLIKPHPDTIKEVDQ